MAPFIDKIRQARASGGFPIGETVGQRHKVVRFPRGGFSSHTLVVGRARTGKTTLMTHLAAARMREGRSLIVIDASGDLITSLLGLIPPGRVDDVVYIDLGDGQHPIGFNPLEVSADRPPQRIEDAVLRAAHRAWPKDWDMEAEGPMTAALRTLLAANEVLARTQESQFTILDLAALFECPGFRRKILHTYVRDPLLLHWWLTFYEELQIDRQLLLLASLFNPLHILGLSKHCRAFLEQPSATVDFRKVLKEEKILLIKTDPFPTYDKAQAFLRAILLDQILWTACEVQADAKMPGRNPLPIFVHGDEPFIFPPHEWALADLECEGITFVISMPFLSCFDHEVPHLSEHLLATRPNLFVFSSIAEDSMLLEVELEHIVPWQELHNLSDWECFFRPRVEERFLPIEGMKAFPALIEDSAMASQVIEHSRANTRPVEQVEAERNKFREKWIGIERSLRYRAFDQGSEAGYESSGEPM
jgi:hypothetical protein